MVDQPPETTAFRSGSRETGVSGCLASYVRVEAGETRGRAGRLWLTLGELWARARVLVKGEGEGSRPEFEGWACKWVAGCLLHSRGRRDSRAEAEQSLLARRADGRRGKVKEKRRGGDCVIIIACLPIREVAV